jgi:uridine kinase
MDWMPALRDAVARTGRDRLVVAIEGIIGSGKSTIAEQVAEAFGGRVIVMGTDNFIRVTRAQWDEYLASGEIVLDQWYDRVKIRQVLEAFGDRRATTVEGLYNLSNGQMNRTLEFDGAAWDMLILEGLFSFHEDLADDIDLRIFLDADEAVTLERARRRDETVRNISPEMWAKKIRIYHDCYVPYTQHYRPTAHLCIEIQ